MSLPSRLVQLLQGCLRSHFLDRVSDVDDADQVADALELTICCQVSIAQDMSQVEGYTYLRVLQG